MPISVSDILDSRDITEPRLSPDGRHVALVITDATGARVHLISLADGQVRPLSDLLVQAGRGLSGGCFDWLPDSSGIVMVAKSGGLQVLSLTGTVKPLCDLPNCSMNAPAVAHDGLAVAFTVDQAEVHTVELATGIAQRLDHGAHAFVADPVWFQGRVIWQAWNPPDMPWDRSVITSANGLLSRAQNCQHQQPHTDSSGQLLAWLDDDSGWLNALVDGRARVDEPFEQASPTWGDRQRSICFNSDGTRLAFVRNEQGFGRLCTYDLDTGAIREHAKAVHGQLSWVGNTLVALRTGGKTPLQVVMYDTTSDDTTHDDTTPNDSWPRRTLLVAPTFDWTDHRALVEPQLLTVTARDGATLFARRYGAPEPNGRMLYMIHGGPTDQLAVTFMPRVTYWIDRGYDVVIPDHRGSTGHGRAFTQAMHSRWGDLDVDDVCDIMESLAHPRSRTAVMGGSAGGLTALGVIMRRPDLVGCTRVVYPVADIAALDATTHRFEAHYNRTLMGDGDETTRRSLARSPIHHADKLVDVPILIFHGTDDPVVGIEQSRQLTAAVTAAGGTIELIEFAGEGHGFRIPANNRREYEATEAFLDQHLS